MRLKTMRMVSVMASSALLMVSFQNCGKAGFDDTSEETLNLSSSSSKTDSDPFAYNAAFD